MTVKEVGGKFYTISKSGKVGKRGFSTKANAEKAQARGRALLSGTTSTPSPASPVSVFDEADTAEERRKLGVPQKGSDEEEEF